MAQKPDQRRASQAIAAWLAHHERNTAWLVRQTGADPGTIGDFLNGQRWPKFRTQGRIEKAIGWEPGTLTRIADGGDVPPIEGTVGPGDDDAAVAPDALLYRRPEGLSDEQWEALKDETREFIEWQLNRASRER